MPGVGYASLRNSIENMGKQAMLNPVTQARSYNDTRSGNAAAGEAEINAAKTLLEIQDLEKSQNITPEQIYAAFGGETTPGMSAEDALGANVLDVGDIQPQDTRPDLRTRANTVSTLHDLGGGNIAQIMDAIGGQQKVGVGDDLLTGQAQPNEIAQIMAALKGSDMVKMDQGTPYDPFGAPGGAQGATGGINAVVDQTIGPGTWKQLNELQRSVIAQDPSIASDPEKFRAVADILSRADVIQLYNNAPGAKVELMKLVQRGGVPAMLEHLQQMANTVNTSQPPPNNDPFGIR